MVRAVNLSSTTCIRWNIDLRSFKIVIELHSSLTHHGRLKVAPGTYAKHTEKKKNPQILDPQKDDFLR